MRSQLDRIFGEDESRDVTAATMGKFPKEQKTLKKPMAPPRAKVSEKRAASHTK